MSVEQGGRVAIVIRGERRLRDDPTPAMTRLAKIFDALASVGLAAELAAYSDDMAGEVRDQLLEVDGVLVWVDPVSGSEDRTRLDAVLGEVAASGVWVSAHPDVIAKIGTKEVLYRTRELCWGTDTHLYRSPAEFAEAFPGRLADSGPRVIKQYRGNGGIGVWKVSLLEDSPVAVPAPEARVRIQNGRLRDEVIEELSLGEFMARCEKYFTYNQGAGRLIDQAFQPRITEGVIRCYLSGAEVVGFSRQYAQGRRPTDEPASAPPAELVMGLPSDKAMFGPDEEAFAALRAKVEEEWVPAMLAVVDLRADELPAIWDADFLFGPRTPAGQDTYVLGEINISAVLPFPDQALLRLAETALASVLAVVNRRRHASA